MAQPPQMYPIQQYPQVAGYTQVVPGSSGQYADPNPPPQTFGFNPVPQFISDPTDFEQFFQELEEEYGDHVEGLD